MMQRSARLYVCVALIATVLLLAYSALANSPSTPTFSLIFPPPSPSSGTTKAAVRMDANRRNLLLVYFDDMRPDLNLAYARPSTRTPNLDKFAASPHSLTFTRAFANYPMCSPSRTSTLFGRTALDTQVMTNLDRVVDTINPSLFKHLQDSGYFTATGGKVFHSKSGKGNAGDGCWNQTYFPNLEQTQAWCNNDHLAEPLRYPNSKRLVSPLICITKADLGKIVDFKVAAGAVQTLKHIRQKSLFPFAMAMGLYKPHFPLHVHEQFFHPAMLTDAEDYRSPFPKASFPFSNLSYAEDGAAIFGLHSTRYSTLGDFSMFSTPPKLFREMIRKSYAAGIAQSDHAFGLVMQALEREGLATNTLVVVMGDHGFGLGEKNLWAKDSLYDVTLRVPLIMHAPWIKPTTTLLNQVKRTEAFFELLDVYRTVVGLVAPHAKKVNELVDGTDHSALVRGGIEFGKSTSAANKFEAYSVVGRCGHYETCTKGMTRLTAVGFTVRTAEHRYTAWVRGNLTSLAWGRDLALAEELYDHRLDSALLLNYTLASFAGEQENVAPSFPSTCDILYQKLRARFEQ
ncbi:hypothetical protein BASA81_005783 [Batrachochytrium salamandrivorans]|nr:hypothetical protein BASA81_005783 [Batrachochytrium salamandrivorans]